METEKYYVEQRQTEAVDQVQELGLAENKSEALRTLVNEGEVSLGLNGHDGATRLQSVVKRLADAFGFAGIVFLGLTFWFPVEVRAVALASTWGVAVVLYGLDRVLARVEPRVSARLPWGGVA